MSKKEIFKTFYGKPIYEGDTYYLVSNRHLVVRGTATTHLLGLDDRSVLTRFSTKEGADKYASKKMTQPFSKKVEPVKEVPKPKTEEELFEERMAALPVMEQLLSVEDQAGFDKWLNRNNYRLSTDNNNISVLSTVAGTQDLITISWGVGGVAYCCGGKEIGSHGGSASRVLVEGTEETRFVLFKYLAQQFDVIIRRTHRDYGLITYVKEAGSITSPSGRFGMMINFSQYFQNVTRFKNPNTGRVLDLYVTTEEWPTNLADNERLAEVVDEEEDIEVEEDEDMEDHQIDWGDDEDED